MDDLNLFVQERMEDALLDRLAGGSIAVFSCKGQLGEGQNEDAAGIYAVDSTSAVLALADGLGGARGGELASGAALKELFRSVGSGDPDGDALRESILKGFEDANRAIVSMGMGAATTLAVVLIQRTTIRCFHTGDSPILLLGQRGRIRFQTVSHSPVGYAVEAGYLDQLEAMYHDERHLVSNVVGSDQMRIEMGPALEMRPRDTLLIASDGLFDNLHLHEIVEECRKGPLARAASRLAEECLARMRSPREGVPSKPDDLTFILFRRGPPTVGSAKPTPLVTPTSARHLDGRPDEPTRP